MHQKERRLLQDQVDENQQAFKDSLYVPVGPITKARSKKIKDALNGLIQEIWSEISKSKIGK